MCLIERFTVVRVSTTPHFIPTSQFHFHKPIRISQCLARHADDIREPQLQNLFRLLKGAYPTGRDDRGSESRIVYSLLYDCDQGNGSSKRSALIRQHSRHAFVTTAARVRVNRLTDLWLMRIFKLAPLRK